MAITIRDVAREAAVSTATVSHVINNSRFVHEETRRRVEEAVRTLGYVANSNARGLRSSVSHRVGLIVPEISDYFPVDILEPIESVLKRAGYQLIIGYTHDDLDNERKQIESFTYQRIDGLLLYPAIGDHAYLRDQRPDYPVVTLDRAAENFTTDCVRADDERAVRDGLSALFRSGRRRVGIILGVEGLSTSASRLEGYRKAHQAHRVAIDPERIKRGSNVPDDGMARTRELLEAGVDAIVATNIAMTIGTLKCLVAEGVRLPDQVAMLGWGDSQWTELTAPPLSVMRHPNQEMGRRAAKLLLQRIKNPGGRPRELLLPVDMVRRSTF